MKNQSAFFIIRVSLGLFVLLSGVIPATIAPGDTVDGHLFYQKINKIESDEHECIFSRGLAVNAPVTHVDVDLLDKHYKIIDSAQTDENGDFTFTNTTDAKYFVVFASNEYVLVRESKLVPLPDDKVLSKLLDLDDINLTSVGIDDDSMTFDAWGVTYPLSRAFFVCESVYRANKNIQELTETGVGFDDGTTLDPVAVRLGLPFDTSYYDRLTGDDFPYYTIHLRGDQADVVDHEYGHHIENSIGAFGIIPKYIHHYLCEEQKSDCWAFFEGLASWWGGVNSLGFNDGIAGVNFFPPPTDSNNNGDAWDYVDALPALGYNYWLEEDANCGGDFTHPEAVEERVGQFLWDLIDDNEDSYNGHYREGAQMPITDVIATLTYPMDSHRACGGEESYTHAASIGDFLYVYLFYIHPDETLHPDLYSALDANGFTIPAQLQDLSSPGTVSVDSPTHTKDVWSNNPNVKISVTDGADDMTGSFYYWYRWDFDPTSELGEGDCTIGFEDFRSKETTYTTPDPHTLAEGDNQWVHVQSRDMAGHLGLDTGHFGPVRIDLTAPKLEVTKFPTGAKPGLIGKYLAFQWDATDALSGVASVSITYKDEGVSQTVSRLPASGAYNFYLDPDVVIPTSAGYFEVTATDVAGNSTEPFTTPSLTIVSPFAGPTDLGLSLDGARIVSGDLNGDGLDEVVISGGGTLRTMQLSTGVTQILAPGLTGGDLFLADTDRDGDLDLVAAGDFGGPSPEIYVFKNDGTGILTSTGPLPVTTMPDMVVRVVDLFGTGEPILVYGGKLGGGAVHKELYYYTLVTGVFGFVNGTVFRGGDFEVGDINADGVFDVVIISFNTAGSYSVSYYLGSKAGNDYTWTEHTISGASSGLIGDVDLGNWDPDNDLDLFIMYQKIGPGGNKAHTEMWQWTGTTFTLNLRALSANSISDGDGHIVDIYNDGRSDVFAMGRPLGGKRASSWFVTNDALGRHGTGVPSPVWSTLLYTTDTAWGDFDNDHDLDVVICGTNSAGTQQIVWYENVASVVTGSNNDPPSPKNLTTTYDSVLGGYTLGWDPPGVNTDRTPESAFEYEITVGTWPGLSDIVSGAHHAGHGQQVAAQPVSGHLERFVPTAGVMIPIYWSVRSVDSGWRRSAPATSY